MTPLTCAFGMPWSWPHVCLFCAAESQRLAEVFSAAVARGEYDAEGYTPIERRKRDRR